MALRLARDCDATVDIDAPIEKVWAVVSDITRVGQWSVECRSCDWIGDDRGPRVGARFRGRNRRNASRWTRTCEVVDVDPPHRFGWRTLPTRLLPDSTEWRFELVGDGDGTRLAESMRIRHLPDRYERLFALMLPQHRDRTADLQADLQRIKKLLEGPAGQR